VIKGAHAVGLMRSVRPFLGCSRRSQIDLAIASWNGRPARWGRPSARCSVEACDISASVRGLCGRHYDQWWKAHRKGRISSIEPIDPPPMDFSRPLSAECTTECDLHWLAGLLEGDGTFGLTGSPTRRYPLISVEMCDRDVVIRAATILGATGAHPREPEEEGWSVTYVAKISGERAAAWMRRLRPLMGLRRCRKPHRSRGLCHAHYMSWTRDRAKGRTPRVAPLR
jgi:hypothetical protein